MKSLKTVSIVFLIVLHSACTLSYFCEDLKTGVEIFSERCSLLNFRQLIRKPFESDDYFENPECTGDFFLTQNSNSCIQTKYITVMPDSVLTIHLNVKSPLEISILQIVFLDNDNKRINETDLLLENVDDWGYWKIKISDYTLEPDFKLRLRFIPGSSDTFIAIDHIYLENDMGSCENECINTSTTEITDSPSVTESPEPPENNSNSDVYEALLITGIVIISICLVWVAVLIVYTSVIKM